MTVVIAELDHSLSDIRDCVTANYLKLNEDKIELVQIDTLNDPSKI